MTGHAEELVSDRLGRGRPGCVVVAELLSAPEVVEDGAATVEVQVFSADPSRVCLAGRGWADFAAGRHRIACRSVATTAPRRAEAALDHVEVVAVWLLDAVCVW